MQQPLDKADAEMLEDRLDIQAIRQHRLAKDLNSQTVYLFHFARFAYLMFVILVLAVFSVYVASVLK